MRLIFHRARCIAVALVAGSASAGCAQEPQAKLPAGAEVQLGGSGREPGQFADLLDMNFDERGELLTLEGSKSHQDGATTYAGNARVQVFDAQGAFLRQFPLGTADQSAHLAADGQGAIYVSFPAQNRVRCYDARGQMLRDFTVQGAGALTAYQRGGQRLVAAIGGYRARQNAPDVGGDAIVLLGAGAPQSVPLSRDLDGVADLSSDGQGNFYALAQVNSIYRFDARGQEQKIIGAGTDEHLSDGSEAGRSLAAAPDGSVYTRAGRYLAKFDAARQTLTRREGTFAWYDPWNIALLRLDGQNRLWAAATDLVKDKRVARYHFRPAILRLQSDFFAPGAKGTLESSLAGVGLKPQLSSAAPDGVAFDLKPFEVRVALPAATRGLTQIGGTYRVTDAFKNIVAQGRIALPLRDGQGAQTAFSFTPPRFGPYTADVAFERDGKIVARAGANFGITPPYAALPRLEAGGDRRADAARQMFAGLPALRLDAKANAKSLDALDENLEKARRAGATVWVQFPDPADAAPDAVRAVATRFKGRVAVYEIVNEPDLKMSAGEYLEILRAAAAVIRREDPAAQIIGPACVNIKLPWHEEFFRAGGGALLDIVSFHDYEGNESIDPAHWRAKIGALRDIMARYGAAAKPLWQTERAIPAVRANTFSGLQQAIRIAQHDDVLQSLGIPPEHNLHYYLQEMGYSAVPSYLWSEAGPHPAVWLLRTRAALTHGLRFAGTLDFGRNGNTFLTGLRFAGDDGELIALRSEGTAPQRLRFAVKGAANWRVTDAWGNETGVASPGGALDLTVGPLPIYLRVPRGATVSAPRLDFGRDIAAQAQFSYAGQTQSESARLANGIGETIHGGLPGGDTKGAQVWRGDLPDPGLESDGTLQNSPALTLSFARPRAVSTFIVRGLPSDNGFSALLDFDVQAQSGGTWRTIAAVKSADPPSESLPIGVTLATSWAQDTQTWVLHWPQSVTARAFRLVPRRTTFGVAFDPLAARAQRETQGKYVPPALWLREIEVYGE